MDLNLKLAVFGETNSVDSKNQNSIRGDFCVSNNLSIIFDFKCSLNV